MTQDNLDTTASRRSHFLIAFLLMLLFGLARLAGQGGDIMSVLHLPVMVFMVIATWRFARSIEMGMAGSLVNTLLAPILFLIPFFALLHYHRRFVDRAEE